MALLTKNESFLTAAAEESIPSVSCDSGSLSEMLEGARSSKSAQPVFLSIQTV